MDDFSNYPRNQTPLAPVKRPDPIVAAVQAVFLAAEMVWYAALLLKSQTNQQRALYLGALAAGFILLAVLLAAARGRKWAFGLWLVFTLYGFWTMYRSGASFVTPWYRLIENVVMALFAAYYLFRLLEPRQR